MLRVLNLNVQGLLNNICELRYVIRTIKPDICVSSETHATVDILNSEINIQGYQLVRTDSHSRHTGGVVMYISNSYNISNINHGAEKFIWWNSIDLTGADNRKIRIVAVYMSASESKADILDYFEQLCDSHCDGCDVIICGDFNIDVSKTTTYSDRLLNICNDIGLKQLVQTATRVTENSSTIIDLCFTNLSADVVVSDEHKISDHNNVEICTIFNDLKNPKCSKTIKTLSHYSQAALLDDIENWIHEWEEMHYMACNEKTQWLVNNLRLSINKFLVAKTVRENNDWFDNELDQLRKQKNMLYKKAQYSGASDDWDIYKSFRNSYKKETDKKQYEHMQKSLDNVKGDAKGVWKLLNSIITDKHTNSNIDSICANGDTITIKSDMANEFNKYYVNTIIDINTSIPNVNPSDDTHYTVDRPFEFRAVGIGRVKDYIKNMKKKNSRDCFDISANILSDAMPLIGTCLTDIVNDSFASSCFPEMLKQSIIVPIRKVPGTKAIEEFRPINTLPCIEKLVEKIACEQFTNYVEENNILCCEQSGFRKSHSCETAINYVISDWKESIEKNEVVLAVFLDFQRAFETIDRNLLIKNLKKNGVGDSALQWFNSFLTQRSQIVRIEDVKSDALNNDFGVPQGSTLGPILFLIHINELKSVLHYSKIKMFADDTLIYISVKNIDDGVRKLNDDLAQIYVKINELKLKLNVNKTKLMIISNRKNINIENVNVHINNTRLQIENKLKYLGLIIDDKLNFKENTNYIARKMAKKTGVLSRVGNKLNMQQKIDIYKTTIEPHINYCSSILFLSTKTDIDRLQKIQNKCMRNILKVDRHFCTNNLLHTLNFLSCDQRIKFNTLVNIFNMVSSKWPKYMCDKISYKNENNRKKTLRSANHLERTKALKTCTQNSLLYKGINLYNNLPFEIKNEKNEKIFKGKLKCYIKSCN